MMHEVGLPSGHPPVSTTDTQVCPFARLNVVSQSHRSNTHTKGLIDAVGGVEALRRFTTRFYQKAFADPHLDQFIARHDDPHGERFATWIAEKFGAGTPWTEERRTRERRQVSIGHGHMVDAPHDRSSAHFAAWHSPKRDDAVWGEHFKLDDCRLWMRLHFWAAREEGFLANKAFADYYVRFIGHFVSVYERTAPPFARESMRWSENPANVQLYLDAGRRMPDIMGLDVRAALASLPAAERRYAGSTEASTWPYEPGE